MKKKVFYFFLLVFVLGFLLPEKLVIPVKGANEKHWAKDDFWKCSWCKGNKIHYGIDIKYYKHTPIISASDGIVIYKGWLGNAGKDIIVLGPKWKLHSYAHLDAYSVPLFGYVRAGEKLGLLGLTGKTTGYHLHYTVVSLLPRIWRFDTSYRGWQKMFLLDPSKELLGY